MKFISCASYHGSGSSAIVDIISEFNSVCSFGNEELRFVHDPNGIADLEYNLVENFNRINSGYAVKKYKELVDFYCGDFFCKRYKRFFGENWRKYSYAYIDKLTDFTYRGWWDYDLRDKGLAFLLLYKLINRILRVTIWKNKPERTLNALKKEVSYCAHPTENEFLKYTKEYIEELFGSVSQNANFVLVDQIVPPTNLKRYLRYFEDIKVFVVDRDPRDVFTLGKYVWKDGMIPNDVGLFCKWFKYTRAHRLADEIDKDKVCFVQFEDMVYKYDETLTRISEWIGLSLKDQIKKKQYFNPELSVNNTFTWKKLKCDLLEIKYIEKHLEEYLYLK